MHTITTKPWPIETAAARYAAAGVRGITVWRDALKNRDPEKIGAMLRDRGLSVVSLCRGGFFPADTAAGRAKALDDSRRAIAEARRAIKRQPLARVTLSAPPRVPDEAVVGVNGRASGRTRSVLVPRRPGPSASADGFGGTP